MRLLAGLDIRALQAGTLRKGKEAMAGYYNYNINPKHRKTSDCVIRAICTASRKPYFQVLKDLYDVSVKTGYCLLDKQCYERVLEAYGFTKHKQPRKYDGSKYLVGEIDELVEDGVECVISMANHLTAYDGEDIIDLWDCRRKSIGNYYTKD